MKTIIAGSRNIINPNELIAALKTVDWIITEVVCGCARGADTLGERYAIKAGLPVRRFPADWDTYGKRAGYLRNQQMADYADALLALWDGRSRGTMHMINIARQKGLKVKVWLVK